MEELVFEVLAEAGPEVAVAAEFGVALAVPVRGREVVRVGMPGMPVGIVISEVKSPSNVENMDSSEEKSKRVGIEKLGAEKVGIEIVGT